VKKTKPKEVKKKTSLIEEKRKEQERKALLGL
jgi:hypothetical protein